MLPACTTGSPAPCYGAPSAVGQRGGSTGARDTTDVLLLPPPCSPLPSLPDCMRCSLCLSGPPPAMVVLLPPNHAACTLWGRTQLSLHPCFLHSVELSRAQLVLLQALALILSPWATAGAFSNPWGSHQPLGCSGGGPSHPPTLLTPTPRVKEEPELEGGTRAGAWLRHPQHPARVATSPSVAPVASSAGYPWGAMEGVSPMAPLSPMAGQSLTAGPRGVAGPGPTF